MTTVNIVILSVVGLILLLYFLLTGAESLQRPNAPSPPLLHRMLALPSVILFAAGAGTFISAIVALAVLLLWPFALIALVVGAIGLWQLWYVYQFGAEVGRRDSSDAGQAGRR